MSINDDKLKEYKSDSLKRDTISLTCALIRLLQMVLFFLWGMQILDINFITVFAPTILVFFIFCFLLILFFIAKYRYNKIVRGVATKNEDL